MWCRRTLWQKSCTWLSKTWAVGGLSEGLNLRPKPRVRDCAGGRMICERLWNSKFCGSRSKMFPCHFVKPFAVTVSCIYFLGPLPQPFLFFDCWGWRGQETEGDRPSEKVTWNVLAVSIGFVSLVWPLPQVRYGHPGLPPVGVGSDFYSWPDLYHSLWIFLRRLLCFVCQRNRAEFGNYFMHCMINHITNWLFIWLKFHFHFLSSFRIFGGFLNFLWYPFWGLCHGTLEVEVVSKAFCWLHDFICLDVICVVWNKSPF